MILTENKLISLEITDYKVINKPSIKNPIVNFEIYVIYLDEMLKKKSLIIYRKDIDFILLYNLLKSKQEFKKIKIYKPKKLNRISGKNVIKYIYNINDNFLSHLIKDDRLQFGINVNDDIQIIKRRKK